MVKMKFQWFFDLATNASSMQIITVSAGGAKVKERLKSFFESYKYYKLGAVKLKMVPASTLPVDPTGLSYESGADTVDPRDQLNPGLTRITNGEDVFEDLTGLSAEQQRGIYYSMMLDTRWYKWSLQSGLRRYATPRYWQVGQLHQDYYPGAVVNVPQIDSDASVTPVVDELETWNLSHVLGNNINYASQNSKWFATIAGNAVLNYGSDPRGFFQTGHRGKLGYLPTDALIDSYAYIAGTESALATPKEYPASAAVPEIECFKIILPCAYKTKYYYRCYVEETVYFTAPVVQNFTVAGTNPPHLEYHYAALDRFIRPDKEWNEKLPTSNEYGDFAGRPTPNNDGGN